MQEIAAFGIVALAAVFAAWKLMPGAMRGRMTRAAVGWALRRGRLSDRGAAALAHRLMKGSCGSCDGCGSCGPEPGTARQEGVVHIVQSGTSGDRTLR